MAARERVAVLIDGQRTVREIAQLAFSDYANVSRILKKMHSAGHIHIAAIVKSKSRPMIIYGQGPGADAKSTFKTTSLERRQRMFERMSADDRDRYRNRHNTKRLKVKVDNLTRAFFGGGR